jgi:hypothetical protein
MACCEVGGASGAPRANTPPQPPRWEVLFSSHLLETAGQAVGLEPLAGDIATPSCASAGAAAAFRRCGRRRLGPAGAPTYRLEE